MGWDVDFQINHSSILDDIEGINRQFYGNLEDELVADILLAMEWYNLSFLSYSPRGLNGKLIDISVAFDTLFGLQKNNITLYDCVNETLGVSDKTPLERWSRDFYGKVRSHTTN